ncbi:DUF2892 domain-containing protein [Aestuariivita sp.]|jgi:general stress protein CsbA|uniref:YgaP family membrane protein n=1 Tax=Aestuariivita sp. TaxID=1872407 RepID=UPI002173CC29|nr:DUF2892 domain-containing protein [Aestuariivita sp.]MCE8007501.1 DUF2892 domain-containing protein [Aestuariivita sp.]
MTANVGTLDRLVRLILGIVLLAAPFVSGSVLFQSTTLFVASILVGLVLIATSALKFCPLYRLLGLRTCRV